jgi:hypothetical protein
LTGDIQRTRDDAVCSINPNPALRTQQAQWLWLCRDPKIQEDRFIMKRVLLAGVILCVLVAAAGQAAAQQKSPVPPAAAPPVAANQVTKLPPAELEKILGPIALYPDVLLAQVLPAATFPLDIVQAARWLRSKPDMKKLQDQKWNPSVLALCNYPDIIYKMDQDLDWTNALGTAFLDQQKDVMTTVQDLRRRARASGALNSSPQQTVVATQGAITIVPAQPEVIYVPQYNPQVVYVAQPAQTVVVQQTSTSAGTVAAASAISFGVGLALGAWLNTDCDWHSHGVVYCQPGAWHGYAHGGAAWSADRVAAWGPNRAVVAGPNGGAYVGPNGAAVWGGGNGATAWARPTTAGRPSYTGQYSSYNSGNRANQVNRGAVNSGNTVNVNNNNVNIDRGNQANVSGGDRTNVGTGDRTNVGGGNGGSAGSGDRTNAGGGNRGNANTGDRTGLGSGDRTSAGVSDRMNTAGGNRATQQPAAGAGGSSAFGGDGRPSQTLEQSQRGSQSRTTGSSQQASRSSNVSAQGAGGGSARSSSFGDGGSRPQTQSYSSRGASSRGGGGGFGGGGGRGGGGRR